jgi:autotransporter-associated beta strand protein
LTQAGTGTTVLTGANTYTGTTTIAAGTLQIGDGGTSGTLGSGDVLNNGTLALNRSDAITIANAITGTGTLVQAGTGTTTVTSAVNAGAVSVVNGSLFLNGATTASTVTAAAGGTLGGSGTIVGAVTIAAGATLAPGASPGTVGALTTGTLTLARESLLAFDLGAPNVVGGAYNDIVHVNGDLTLGGTLNVTDAGAFASMPGSYRLMTYTGSLTGSAADIAIGSTPGYSPSDVFVQTSVARSVNLIVTRAGLPISFWDGSGAADNGAIEGGSGAWGPGGSTWTNVNGSINQSWIAGMAVFDGTGGTVSLTGDVQARALQFASDGYSIAGSSSLTLLGMPDGSASIVRVDPDVTATIAASLAGTSGLVKLDSGTLVLSGANSYTGGTTVAGGTLRVNGSVVGRVDVAAGATLGGSGSIFGDVIVGLGGTIAPGASVGTLTVGSLTLRSGSILNYEFSRPDVVGGGANDLIVVTGDLTLAGTVNVAALEGFGVGTYRLMTYGGAMTDNGLAFGILPAGFGYQLLTNVPGQVSLQVVGARSASAQYWDGSNTVGNGVVNGGSGTWSNGITNWTGPDGNVNQAWGGGKAIFGGAAGVVTVAGDVAFTGLEFLTSGYTLVQGSGGALVTSTPITDVRLHSGVAATIGVRIVGPGGLSIQGPGTLTLTADNSYTGGTAIGVGSTLQLGNGGTSGRIVGNVLNDGTLVFNRSDVIEFPGTIFGRGTLHQAGGGTLVLTGTNSYSGGTVIHTGTISISDDANLGAASGALVFHDGALQVTADTSSSRTTLLAGPRGTIETAGQSTTFGLSGVIGGSGQLVKSGDGTLVLSGENAYSGGTLIRSGTLSISADANLGAPSGNVTISGGTLRTTATIASARSIDLDTSGTIETANQSLFLHEGTITGGALSKSGDGLLLLTGTNTYSGGTTIAQGALQIGNCGTAGSIVGNVRNDGALVLARQDTFAFAGAISGTGLVVKECAGTTILTGSNSYTGGTLVSAGTLQGNTQSLQGTIVDLGSLVFDESGDGTFRGTLVGTGSLTKTGDGTLRLTGNHGLLGLTTVQTGTLQLDGTLAGAVHVANGATFFVNGAVGGNLSVDGAVSIRQPADADPGERPRVDSTLTNQQPADTDFGELAVLGNLALRPGAELRIAIDAAGRSSTLVTGGMTIFAGGNIAIDPLGGGFNRVTHHALLGAGIGFAGTPTVTSSTAAIEPYLTLDDDTLFVTLLNTEVPLQPFAATGNGWSIGGAVDRLRHDATGDLLHVTRQLTALDDAHLSQALDAVSGEIHASATQMAALDGESIVDVVRSEISGRVVSRPVEGPASAQSLWGSGRRRTWVRLRGERARFDGGPLTGSQGGRAAAHGAHASLAGFALGLDWSFSTHWLAGAGGGYGTGSLRLDGLSERTDYVAPRALGYLGYARGRWGLHGGASVAHTDYDITRAFQFAAIAPTGRPLFGPVDRIAVSAPSGPATELWLDGRFVARLGSWDAQPMGGLRSAWFHLGEWTESGADALSLSGPAQTTRSLQADAGLRLLRAVGRVRPLFQGTYRRELAGGGTTTTVELSDLPGGRFEVEGVPFTLDEVIGQAGLMFLTDRMGFSVFYEMQRARSQSRQSLQVSVGF